MSTNDSPRNNSPRGLHEVDSCKYNSRRDVRRMSLFDLTESEDDVALYAELQEASLLPIKDDLADWLNGLLGCAVTADDFIPQLETGSLLCQLANCITEQSQNYDGDTGETTKTQNGAVKYRRTARPQTWYARDNTANFLTWCRTFGVNDGCMFESDDLVSAKRPRSVVLCLLEIARLAHQRFGIEPPTLIKIEKELEDNELEIQAKEDRMRQMLLHKDVVIVEGQNRDRDKKGDGLYYSNSSHGVGDQSQKSSHNCEKVNESVKTCNSNSNLTKSRNEIKTFDETDFMVKDVKIIQNNTESGGTNSPSGVRNKSAGDQRRDSLTTTKSPKQRPLSGGNVRSDKQQTDSKTKKSTSQRPYSAGTRRASSVPCVDVEVKRMSKKYSCADFVKRIDEGTYDIYGRTVLVRLLKGRHLMVRVGGGWDTLEHYLIKHSPSKFISFRRSDMDINAGSFLYAKGQYRNT